MMKWNTNLYDDKHAFVFEYGNSLVELLDPKPEDRILDLGCGTGHLTHAISAHTPYVIGMDASSEMIRAAEQNFPNIAFFVTDATHFDFEKPFDAIFSNATLHWVLDYTACAKSMYRNLKDGGKLVVEFGGKGNVKKIIDALRHHLRAYNYVEQSQFQQWYFPSLATYSQVLESVGFRVTLAQHYNRPTVLADNENGIKDWLHMFAKNFFVDVKDSDREAILNAVQDDLKPELFASGQWYADYKRLRIVAIKETL